MEGIRSFTNKDGIFRTTDLETSEGTREYDVDNGFPSDFLATHSLYLGTVLLYPMLRKERDEASSNGNPAFYYIMNRKIGFNVPCSSATGDITFNYFGKGDDVSADGSDVLAELSIMDDDTHWDAIIKYCSKCM